MKWLMKGWQLYQSTIDQKQYLLIKIEWIEFSIEGLEPDHEWSKHDSEYFAEIYQEVSKSKPNDKMILFIISVENISIPNPLVYTPIVLNITLNNYRPLYNLTWSQEDVTKEVEIFVDSIDAKTRIEVNFIKTIKRIDGLCTIHGMRFDYQEETKDDTTDKIKISRQIWNKLLTKNIFSLWIEETIKEKWLVKFIVDFWSIKNKANEFKLNDIELKLNNTKDVKRIFEVLKDNYMIKTVKMNTVKRIDLEVEKIAEEFRLKRIGTEMCLNSRNKRFRICENKWVQIYYPNDE